LNPLLLAEAGAQAISLEMIRDWVFGASAIVTAICWGIIILRFLAKWGVIHGTSLPRILREQYEAEAVRGLLSSAWLAAYPLIMWLIYGILLWMSGGLGGGVQPVQPQFPTG